MSDDEDDFRAERAYDKAYRTHQRNDAYEQRDTGTSLDPFPTFDQWLHPTPDDEAQTGNVPHG